MEKNLILLFGGESAERLVSVASAQAMAVALTPKKIWFWHKDGGIYNTKLSQLIAHNEPFTKEFSPLEPAAFKSIEAAISSKQAADHVFVLAVHGGFCENGGLQALLEKHGRAYTGSNAVASKNAFDKVISKKVLEESSLNMAPHKIINKNDFDLKMLETIFDQLGPVVIKPINGGSSIDCFFLRSFEQVESVFKDIVASSCQDFMAEQLIEGRELTCGVVEGQDGIYALPVTEIIVDKTRNFDYDGKYLGKGTKEITPADISEKTKRLAQSMAMSAHAGLKLEGYSRTDMILKDEQLYFLEINTLPGLSKQSLVPQELTEARITMREFLAAQIELAKSRLKSNQNNRQESR